MLNKKVVLGSLVAGAFLLPAVASAGVVNGTCSNCHTMHQTDGDGAAVTVTKVLLSADCIGCHAQGAANNGSGVGGTVNAPQVNTTTNTVAGGYFNSTDANSHNISGLNGVDATLATSPGGAFGTASLQCNSCHTGTGGHHGTGGGYRLLGVGEKTDGDAAYGVGGRSANTYNVALNGFCAGCHATFHATSGSTGNWTYHPVGIDVATAGGSSITTAYLAAEEDTVPVGEKTANVDEILCLSCHVPHGSAYANLLAFNYSGISAGDGTRTAGCETCHSYGNSGM